MVDTFVAQQQLARARRVWLVAVKTEEYYGNNTSVIPSDVLGCTGATTITTKKIVALHNIVSYNIHI